MVARLQLLAAALLFSTGGAAIKACSLGGWQVAGMRSGIAALTLAMLVPAGRRGWQPRTFAVGVVYAATLVLYVNANKLTTAANTIFLQSTAPLYVMLLGPLLLKERFRRADLPFAGLLAIGMVLFLTGSEAPQATAPNPVAGNVLGAIAGVTWALTILGLRWLGRDERPGAPSAASAVVVGNAIAFATCVPAAIPLEIGTATDWWIVAYLGVFQIGVAYLFVTRSVRHVPSLEASLLLLLEPVLNACWAWLFLGERPAGRSLVGGTIILVSTLGFVVRSRRP